MAENQVKIDPNYLNELPGIDKLIKIINKKLYKLNLKNSIVIDIYLYIYLYYINYSKFVREYH